MLGSSLARAAAAMAAMAMSSAMAAGSASSFDQAFNFQRDPSFNRKRRIYSRHAKAHRGQSGDKLARKAMKGRVGLATLR